MDRGTKVTMNSFTLSMANRAISPNGTKKIKMKQIRKKPRMLKTESIRIPLCNPDEAEIINVATIDKQIMANNSWFCVRPRTVFSPPDIVNMPAPRDADIPATKAYKLITSTRVPTLP